jgi:hypothetical protein
MAIIEIIDEYIKIKMESFQEFIQTCLKLQEIDIDNKIEALDFITKLLSPNVDARIFEIVSFAILKYFYNDQKVFW